MKLHWVMWATVLAACAPTQPPRGADEEGQIGREPMERAADTPAAGTAGTRTPPRGETERPFAVMVDPTAPSPQPADELVAAVVGTSRYPNLRGTVSFRPGPDGVRVETRVDGLLAGAHGYHVHTYGDCSDPAAKSMGGHLDFAALPGPATRPDAAVLGPDATPGTQSSSSTNTPSGVAATAPPSGARGVTATSPIHGNLGELTGGRGTSSATESLPLGNGQLAHIVGRAVVIHENPNDESRPPDGAAGTAIACGVIGVANVQAGSDAAATPGGEP